MPKIQVDIISDVMCPWCYIGKRRLEKAMALYPEAEYEVSWHPFLLDPTIPDDGMDREEYVTRKFGDRAKTFYEHIKSVAKDEGLDLDFERITRSPKTVDAHRLIQWAGQAGVQDDVSEGLFRAFFEDGKDPTRHEVLLDIAESAGLDRDEISEKLNSDLDRDLIFTAIGEAQKMGVTGVPFFIINRQYGIPGAQDAEPLADAFRQIAEKTA